MGGLDHVRYDRCRPHACPTVRLDPIRSDHRRRTFGDKRAVSISVPAASRLTAHDLHYRAERQRKQDSLAVVYLNWPVLRRRKLAFEKHSTRSLDRILNRRGITSNETDTIRAHGRDSRADRCRSLKVQSTPPSDFTRRRSSQQTGLVCFIFQG